MNGIHERVRSLSEEQHRLLSTDPRKVLEEAIKRVPSRQVVEERLHGYPSAHEHGGAAEDIRVPQEDGFHEGASDCGSSASRRRNASIALTRSNIFLRWGVSSGGRAISSSNSRVPMGDRRSVRFIPIFPVQLR